MPNLYVDVCGLWRRFVCSWLGHGRITSFGTMLTLKRFARSSCKRRHWTHRRSLLNKKRKGTYVFKRCISAHIRHEDLFNAVKSQANPMFAGGGALWISQGCLLATEEIPTLGRIKLWHRSTTIRTMATATVWSEDCPLWCRRIQYRTVKLLLLLYNSNR